MDEVKKFRMWAWMAATDATEPRVFVLHEDYAKLQAELNEGRKKTSTSMGVGCGFVYGDYESIKAAQAIVIRLEKATARISSLEAQLTACTQAHYGKMAGEAKKMATTVKCNIPGHMLDPETGRCLSCTGFAERPQTQGL